VSADFRSSVSAARVGERVAFSDLTRVMTGAEPVTAWKWEFGDGNTSSEQNPVHSYGAPGVYAVSLAVQSASGSDVRIRPNCVKVSIPDVPKADFVAAARKPTINTPLQFNDLSVPGASDIVGWLWDFGDGAWSAEQHPVHIYNTAAVYDVYLTVNNANGSDTSVKLGYIEVQAGLPQSLPE
ncbi:MAG TPA: PKD domain-containing protein, partial [Candidatus Hydrogenedentes bacterium]|nr:PKD domain-containing protein [Candidatus Hydrogenedentota bacterium]